MRQLAFFAIVLGFATSASAETRPASTDNRFQELFGTWQSFDDLPARTMPVVVVSKAGDALGRPIDLSQVAVLRTTSGRPLLGSGGAFPVLRPLASSVMTSSFGARRDPLLGGTRAHMGVDLAAPTGTPIMATSDGVVSEANWRGGYGLFVALKHGGGIETRYGHMSRLNVYGGQRVRKGDVIGFVGSTGRSTGPHLHYEVRMNGQAMNPVPVPNKR